MNFSLTKTKILLLFATIGFVIYANTFNNQMFWDDQDIILRNTFVQNFEFSKFFSENQIAGAGLISNYWRPLLLVVFSVEWQLWGPDPFGYHLVNTAFHVANAVLLFYILQRLFKKQLLSLLTGFAFLVHPLQTEAVTYISGLADPLSTFFIFIGIWFYFKFRDEGKLKYFAFVFGSYLLALLSKDTAVVMPGLLLITDFFYLPHSLSIKQRLVRVAKNIWPFFVMAFIYLWLRATVLNFKDTFNVYGEENLFTESFWVRLMAFFRAMTTYFELLFWPHDLHMERSFEIPTSLAQPDVLLGGLLTLGMVVTALLTIKKYPIVSFGILWFFARLFPNSNLLFPNAGLIYEHWMYVPMIGIFIIIIWLLLKLAEKFDQTSEYDFKKIAAGAFMIYLVPLSIKTIDRNNDWQDPITFYNQTAEYTQDSYRIWNNLGMAYADAGRSDEAIENYEKAISLSPENAVAYHNLANSYRDLGQYDSAIENYEKAIGLQSDFLFSYNSLAQLYLNLKNYDKAIETLERLKSANPGQETYVNSLIEQITKLPQ
jgi:tetratricopeptide (TPR) repeat protein